MQSMSCARILSCYFFFKFTAKIMRFGSNVPFLKICLRFFCFKSLRLEPAGEWVSGVYGKRYL